jgi:hypothetical protein
MDVESKAEKRSMVIWFVSAGTPFGNNCIEKAVKEMLRVFWFKV